MSADRSDCLVFWMHEGFGNNVCKTPRPFVIDIRWRQQRATTDTAEVKSRKRQSETAHIYPVSSVKPATNLVFGKISHWRHCDIKTEASLVWRDRYALGA